MQIQYDVTVSHPDYKSLKVTVYCKRSEDPLIKAFQLSQDLTQVPMSYTSKRGRFKTKYQVRRIR